MEVIKGANLLLRFLLELCALGALGYWDFKTGSGTPAKVGLGVGAPLVAGVVWAMFVSPQASVQLPAFLVLLLQVLVFGSATAGLVATGHRTVAVAFGVLIGEGAGGRGNPDAIHASGGTGMKRLIRWSATLYRRGRSQQLGW
jgi:hypothetical protein